MHQSIPAAPPPPPPPPPRATAGHFRTLSVPGVGHLQILRCSGAGHLPTPGPTSSFWHSRGFLSEYNYTEDFTGKTTRLAHLSKTGKIEEVCKSMLSILCMPFFIALLSQNYIAKSGAIDVNQRFLGFIIELNFRWYYLKKILLYS